MSRGKLAVCVLIAGALLCWQFLPTRVGNSRAGIECPCECLHASIAVEGACLLSCPAGDGATLGAQGAVVTVVVEDLAGAGIPGIPAQDFWLFGCGSGLALCGGHASIDADHDTDATGTTTLSGAFAVGGCDSGVKVLVQGVVVTDPLDCARDLCLPLEVRSADIDGNLVVNVADIGLFTLDYPSPPKAYNPCVDFNCQTDLGVAVGIVDLGLFTLHNFHACL